MAPCSERCSRCRRPDCGSGRLRSVSRSVFVVDPPPLSNRRLCAGVVYFTECPQQPNIPNVLLGLALITLIMAPFFNLPCDRHAAQPQENPRGFKRRLMGLSGLFVFIWILLGTFSPYDLKAPTPSVHNTLWLFSVYQPNYDPAAAGGLYCNWNLYAFAFWNAVYETFAIGWMLARLCKGMLIYAVMTPAATSTDF